MGGSARHGLPGAASRPAGLRPAPRLAPGECGAAAPRPGERGLVVHGAARGPGGAPPAARSVGPHPGPLFAAAESGSKQNGMRGPIENHPGGGTPGRGLKGPASVPPPRGLRARPRHNTRRGAAPWPPAFLPARRPGCGSPPGPALRRGRAWPLYPADARRGRARVAGSARRPPPPRPACSAGLGLLRASRCPSRHLLGPPCLALRRP